MSDDHRGCVKTPDMVVSPGLPGGFGMSGFVEGNGRRERLLLPACLDDYVAEDNPVRIVDVFIGELDLLALGFAGPAATGRPGYSPATMLKLYLYGYLNQVQSSRRLEREAGRNVECMWLTGKLAPDFKTIADFRRDGGGGWQPLQGGEYSRQELHAWRNSSEKGAGRRQHSAVSGDARHGRPSGE